MTPDEARKFLEEVNHKDLTAMLDELNEVLKKHDYSIDPTASLQAISGDMFKLAPGFGFKRGFSPVRPIG